MAAEQNEPVFSWTFNSLRELRQGLQEYLSFLDGTVTTHYGLEHGERDADPTVYMNAARRRSEIDACMESLQDTSPLLWRTLDVHYRRGASIQPRGWTVTAGCIGLRRATCPVGVRCVLRAGSTDEEERRLDKPACRAAERLGCQQDRDDLQRQLTMATRRLHQIHQLRRRYKSGVVLTNEAR